MEADVLDIRNDSFFGGDTLGDFDFYVGKKKKKLVAKKSTQATRVRQPDMNSLGSRSVGLPISNKPSISSNAESPIIPISNSPKLIETYRQTSIYRQPNDTRFFYFNRDGEKLYFDDSTSIKSDIDVEYPDRKLDVITTPSNASEEEKKATEEVKKGVIQPESWFNKEMIKGVKNTYLALSGGVVLLIVVAAVVVMSRGKK